MTEEIQRIIQAIESDINYFNNIGFYALAEKFKRDLETIRSILNNCENKN